MTEQVVEIPVEYKRLFDTDWREAAVYGGRYSLKSHTVARVLLISARQRKLRIGCFREFQNSIAESSHQLLADLIDKYNLKEFKVTDNAIINQLNGSDFIFKGLHHNEQSVKSIEGIDKAWVEEAQTISNKSIEVLTPTIRNPGSQIIWTYNRLEEEDPVHKRLVIEGRPNTLIINANYDIALKYNWMPDEIRLEMEDDRERRPNLYKHKWLGEPNTQEGRIYQDWNFIDEIPHEAKLVRYGLDFGYSIDPTVIVAIYYYNGGYIVDEVTYQKGLSNRSIADILENQPKALVIADSAEPKSIDEIHNYGINIQGVTKGADSVRNGIQYVQEHRVSLTNRSIKTKTAYLNYKWATDKDGRPMNTPDDTIHEWSNPLDAIRYGFESLRPKKEHKRVIVKRSKFHV
jgi:PBSX family phage terminase large subunit